MIIWSIYSKNVVKFGKLFYLNFVIKLNSYTKYSVLLTIVLSIIILHVVDSNFNQLFNFGDEMEINCLLAISNPFVSLARGGPRRG